MSESHHTRNLDPDVYREHARALIAAARAGAAVTLEQLTAIARIRVRVHARANRHELGAWRHDRGAGLETIACLNCQARAYLDRATGLERVGELLEACS